MRRDVRMAVKDANSDIVVLGERLEQVLACALRMPMIRLDLAFEERSLAYIGATQWTLPRLCLPAGKHIWMRYAFGL
jgi:hypothetical protein